jgi:hypothetical protein
MRATGVCLILFVFAGLAGAGPSLPSVPPGRSPEPLRAEIESLKAARVPWRGIAWQSCLLEGLRESRARNKPVLLWIFIDRPTDDSRC